LYSSLNGELRLKWSGQLEYNCTRHKMCCWTIHKTSTYSFNNILTGEKIVGFYKNVELVY